MDEVEEVKSRLNIEDVISEYVQLKRAGSNFKGLSPWTNEKTASLMVSPAKQIWHDFSSGKGGNMFSFVMEMEGLDFKGALELLARKAGVQLSRYQSSDIRSRSALKQKLVQINILATKFYQAHMAKSATAQNYLINKRGFKKSTILQFKLGYAPAGGQELTRFMLKRGLNINDLQTAGLVAKNRSTTDMFRGRIIIPLSDEHGQIVGFTARLLRDQPNSPKYINTPQTLLYDKSRHVYGLDLAKAAIRQTKFAVITEGNLDVIASHQAGQQMVVATAGTALGSQHLKLLSRFSSDIRLAFDRDPAGIVATERSLSLAQDLGIQLSVIDIPGAKDPDELIQKDPALWQSAIAKPQEAVDWLIEQYRQSTDLNTYAGRETFKKSVFSLLRRLKSSGEQTVYAKRAAELLGYHPEAVMAEIQHQKTTHTPLKRPKNPSTTKTIDQSRLEIKKIQDHLLAICLKQPPLRQYLRDLAPEMLSDSNARTLFEQLYDSAEADIEFANSAMLQDIRDYVTILELQYEELYQDLGLLELRNEAARLQVRLIENYVKTKKKLIAEELRQADEQQSHALLKEVKSLDELLKAH